MADDVSTVPIHVAAVRGAVVILAPQGPVALSPLAALESSQRLLDAAQRVLKGEVDDLEQD